MHLDRVWTTSILAAGLLSSIGVSSSEQLEFSGNAQNEFVHMALDKLAA
jgi:hypothetical protein